MCTDVGVNRNLGLLRGRHHDTRILRAKRLGGEFPDSFIGSRVNSAIPNVVMLLRTPTQRGWPTRLSSFSDLSSSRLPVHLQSISRHSECAMGR